MFRLTGAVILKIAYGYEVKDKDDALVQLVDRAVSGFTEASTAGSYLVDILHICGYMCSDVQGMVPELILTSQWNMFPRGFQAADGRYKARNGGKSSMTWRISRLLPPERMRSV